MSNDFTKEELKLLIEALEDAWGVSSDNHLYSKIQSMIDNYCGHKCSVCKTMHYGGYDCGIGRIKSE